MNSYDDRITRPAFLDLLDTDPRAAASGIYHFVSGFMKSAPPRLWRQIGENDRPDLFQAIILHLIADNFRILRQYQSRGRPFSAWLYWVVRNRLLDHLKRSDNSFEELDYLDEDGSHQPHGSTRTNPETTTEIKRLLDVVNDCLLEIDDFCRLLLRMAAREFKPKEICRAMRLPMDEAKRISSRVKYCRKKLEDLIVRSGASLDDLRQAIHGS